MIDPNDDTVIEYVAKAIQGKSYPKHGEIRPSYICARTVLVALKIRERIENETSD